MIYTTLNKTRDCAPCAESWVTYLRHLGKTQPDDEPVEIADVLAVCGLNDALWTLRATNADERDMRLFGVWCAWQVRHLLVDQRSLDAIDVSERYAMGSATREEMIAAWSAAMKAVTDKASEAAEACARLNTADAVWWAGALAAELVGEDTIRQEFERVFCGQ